RRGDAGQPAAQLGKAMVIGRLGHLDRRGLEAHGVAGAKLTKRVKVGADDLSDFRIAADRLPVHAEHDALPVIGDLHGGAADRLGNHLAARPRQRLALQAKAHAVAGWSDREDLAYETRLVEPVGLGAREETEYVGELRRQRHAGGTVEEARRKPGGGTGES